MDLGLLNDGIIAPGGNNANKQTSRGYKSTNVKRQFDKVRSVPREDLLSAKTKEKKNSFPLGR